MENHPRWQRPVAVVAMIFGALTIFSGGTVIFGDAATKALAGNAVSFVVWFNFLAGFVYIYGANALWTYSPHAKRLARVIGVATLAIFGLFLVKVIGGTPFEMRTVGAMALRTGFWLAIGFALPRAVRP